MVAVLLLVASGCGNERRDFRVEKLNPLVRRVSEERAYLATLLRSARPHRTRDAKLLRRQLARVVAQMGMLSALQPPDGTHREFRRYVRSNRDLAAALSRFVDAFVSGNGPRQRAAASRVRGAVAAATRAQVRLQHVLQ